MYFNVFTDALAPIWFVLYYCFYYFSFVNFKLLFSEDKQRLLTYFILGLFSLIYESFDWISVLWANKESAV